LLHVYIQGLVTYVTYCYPTALEMSVPVYTPVWPTSNEK